MASLYHWSYRAVSTKKERSVISVLKLFRAILSADRKRRRFAVGLALRMLRLICDIEKDEVYRLSDKLDVFPIESQSISRCDYIAIEEECADCECTLGFLESAIEDLEYAY